MKSYKKYKKYNDYINNYFVAQNAATGSKFDQNANVAVKNVATLNGELFKGDSIGLNRYRMDVKLKEMYCKKISKQYFKDLKYHSIYRHDETQPLYPYCVAVSMYPLLSKGMKKLGGISNPPTNLKSFCGIFVNFIFILSSQFAGAVATPEFLTYFDHFARKAYGDNYINTLDKVLYSINGKDITIQSELDGYFQNVIYGVNQPAAARNFQSAFWNIAYFDEFYFKNVFKDFIFPDGDEPCWETTKELQFYFMEWFRKERMKDSTIDLTFPVENANALDNGKDDLLDTEFKERLAEIWSKGHETFLYHSDSVDSISSCCRLNNGITQEVFSTSLGAGGIATGSKGVITINVNRLVQNAVKNYLFVNHRGWNEYSKQRIIKAVDKQVRSIHKYLTAWNELLWELYENDMLPIYSAKFIDLNKQYLTIGINGFIEGAEYLGIEISPNSEDYKEYSESILGTIYKLNKEAKTEKTMFNTEFVPAEGLGVKHAKWDKEDGYFVPRECYNSYFYPVESEDLNVTDKMILHGRHFVSCLDGGSAYHINLKECLSKEQYCNLIESSVKLGANNIVVNVPETICKECGTIQKRMTDNCCNCGRSDCLDYVTRIIGYRKRVSKWNITKQSEFFKRHFN